ncbi:sensor histidine kinase [Caulobacter sp. BK020]|uniref:sensor histidine kinase n=1 Tax=Caulobacter sp. BK020 TaxID=2512117 RepID=UPI0010522F2A|nr:sensor histidine kinase [Caulobacter sp. BK020]TCS13140.1 two component regulator with propeller domain [Caulobacter sp. BK020]
MKTAARLLLAIALLLGLGGRALALDPARSILQFKHTSWTAEDGAPTNIWALAQTPDGYLWLGAAGGLYRFDGVAFEAVPLADDDYSHSQHVNALVVTPSGELWAGYRRGGIAVFRDGKLRELPSADRDGVLTMTAAPDGAVWVALNSIKHNLARFVGGQRQDIDPSWNLPEGYIMDLKITRDGTLWVAIDGSLSFLRPGARRFERTEVVMGAGAGLAEDPSGRLWVSDSLGARPLPNVAKGEPVPAGATGYAVSDSARYARILFDRQGALWGTTFSTGAFRVARPDSALTAGAPRPHAETYEAKDGLSSDKAVPILEDREGNLWIGTSIGLDRLRTANVVVEPGIARSSRFGYMQFADRDGAVWIGDSEAVYRALPGQAPRMMRDRLSNPTALCQDKAGGVWLGAGDLLTRLGGRPRTATPPVPSGAPYSGCVIDGRGDLWLALFPLGYGRLDAQGRWTVSPPLEANAIYSDVEIDREGRVLLPRPRVLTRIAPDGTVQTLRPPAKLAVGGMRAFYQGPKDFLIGCEFGLLRLTGDRFQALQVARFPWAKGVQGVVQTPAGETWVLGALGVVQMRTEDLDRAFDDPSRSVSYRLFNMKDGLPGPPQQNGVRDVVRGGDGRIWLLTLEGVAWIDPARIDRNALPPPVLIRSLTVNGQVRRDPRDLVLPRGASKLQIDYTALSLSVPERVRFRYRLEGVDKDWVEAGGRRQAFYTNLKPGRYRFQVLAANNDGVWNDRGAVLAFENPPTFVQTNLFRALCVLAVIGVLWGLYALRLRQMSDRIHGRLQERMAERERIARELHDTLLQGVQGLMLRLQSVADQIPADQPARQALESALDRADDVVVEGRDRVRSLRADRAGDLHEILAEQVERLGLEPAIKVRMVVEGTPRRLHPLVCEEIERIASEALFNTQRHAQARNVEITVGYGRGALTVLFRDDGLGLDQTVLDSGRREGHFGLTGMGERARKIQGEFELRSRPGAGTEIALTIPGGVAYLSSGRRAWPSFRRRALTSET